MSAMATHATGLTSTLEGSSLEQHNATFREAMSHLASGVVVVTASIDGRPWGMTVSAACPVCTEPPTMLVSLGARTALSHAILETERFGVSVLGAAAVDTAKFAAEVGRPKFLDDGIGMRLDGAHPTAVAVEGAVGHVDCEVVEVVEHRTHRLFLGRVRATSVRPGDGPLVHYRRGFHALPGAA